MSFKIMILINFLICLLIIFIPPDVNGNQDAKRLYEDLFRNYNLLIRPVENNSDFINVKLSLRLIKIIELNLNNQFLMTNMWIKQEWTDYNLKWNPNDYGNLKQLYVPSDKLWLPDIVNINSADGAYEVAIKTKAIIHYNGTIVWQSPITLKSSCDIDLSYYPLDEQICMIRFGTWTYGSMINLRHHYFRSSTFTESSIDLRDYNLNTEFDIMSINSSILSKRKHLYNNEPYSDIFFTIRLRRKALFYTFSLLIPCFSLSFMTVFTFYLPTNSGKKISLAISILVSLSFLLLIFIDLMPSTSICLPLLGKYLIFILILVVSSIVVTCFIVNIHFRSPSTHIMSPWFRNFFLNTLPPYLLINLPIKKTNLLKNSNLKASTPINDDDTTNKKFSSILQRTQSTTNDGYVYPAEVNRAIRNALFIAYHLDNENSYENCKEDWIILALVLDRIFFYLFFIVCITGTAGIFFQAPTLYDRSFPIDIQQSMIGKENDIQSILHNF